MGLFAALPFLGKTVGAGSLTAGGALAAGGLSSLGNAAIGRWAARGRIKDLQRLGLTPQEIVGGGGASGLQGADSSILGNGQGLQRGIEMAFEASENQKDRESQQQIAHVNERATLGSAGIGANASIQVRQMQTQHEYLQWKRQLSGNPAQAASVAIFRDAGIADPDGAFRPWAFANFTSYAEARDAFNRALAKGSYSDRELQAIVTQVERFTGDRGSAETATALGVGAGITLKAGLGALADAIRAFRGRSMGSTGTGGSTSRPSPGETPFSTRRPPGASSSGRRQYDGY